MTEAERKLWYAVRDRRMAGFRFVRQEPIGPFVADFCCREAKLVVELDGSQHAESRRDKIRDEQLARLGYRVLRFWNHEALLTMDVVLETIFARLTGRS